MCKIKYADVQSFSFTNFIHLLFLLYKTASSHSCSQGTVTYMFIVYSIDFECETPICKILLVYDYL